jgi:DMSO/TMAO reductase YedYZ molybdopterin-dependent catalytic subunit
VNPSKISRRSLLVRGGAAVAGLALLQSPLSALAFPVRAGEEVIPWLDQPPPNPIPTVVTNLLDWQKLEDWVTPNKEFFGVGHYNWPVIDEKAWQLEIGGLVREERTFSLSDLKALPRKETTFTLECAGDNGFDWFTGGVGTARWAGTPLAPILEAAGVLDEGIEVVFTGTDEGEETVRDIKMKQNFARSMSLADAMNPDNLLCYEMNGEALPQAHGYPLRLIAPGWYGIANVKWLKRIELRNTRLENRFMARDYVTIRAEDYRGETVWAETSVGRALLKSAPAKVVVGKDGQHRIYGAAWGAPIRRVEVQIDKGPWVRAKIDWKQHAPFAWKHWSLDWDKAAAGDHTITSRAIDTQGNVQPAMDDPIIANKKTYWESNGQITRKIRIG